MKEGCDASQSCSDGLAECVVYAEVDPFEFEDCGEDGFCSEEGICEWPQSECPAEAPHPCYNENNELVSCEMDEFACYGDGSNHSGPRL